MAKLSNIIEAETELRKYIPLSGKVTGQNLTVKRMKPLMDALGNPQRSLKIVHIAGTSGKSSTAYYIAAMLSSAGYKTGLTISPHIDSITERIQINLKPISEAEFCRSLSEVIKLVESAKIIPTYFELLVGLAYWYFKKSKVDYAVIETGIGGLYDSTNIASNSDKLCVITDIGYDHMELLGRTLPEIARQKAGIIYPGNDVLMYRQSEEINKTFKDWCKDHKARLHFLKKLELKERFIGSDVFKELPDFQQRNWLLAYATHEFLPENNGLAKLSDRQLADSLKMLIPGRMEKHVINGKTLIMDGAHNEQKLKAFKKSFKKQYPGVKATVLISIKKDKKYPLILKHLKPITDTLIVSGFSPVKGTPVQSLAAKELSREAKAAGFEHIISIADAEAAYKRLHTEVKEIGIIIGSFYLLSELRRSHKELKYV